MEHITTQEYPYLPAGRTILYVPMVNPFMAEAKKVCLENSTDHNHPTGAVVVKNGIIVGRGANQSAIRNKLLLNLHKEYFCIRKWLHIKSGTHYWLCPGCASSKMHAEPRAVKDAQKNAGDITGADLYLWGHWWCCKPCWDSMIGRGIHNVYLLNESVALFKK